MTVRNTDRRHTGLRTATSGIRPRSCAPPDGPRSSGRNTSVSVHNTETLAIGRGTFGSPLGQSRAGTTAIFTTSEGTGMDTVEPNAHGDGTREDSQSQGLDPRDTDHPTGSRQAEENADNDPPG
jgi:hypothetical protein